MSPALLRGAILVLVCTTVFAAPQTSNSTSTASATTASSPVTTASKSSTAASKSSTTAAASAPSAVPTTAPSTVNTSASTNPSIATTAPQASTSATTVAPTTAPSTSTTAPSTSTTAPSTSTTAPSTSTTEKSTSHPLTPEQDLATLKKGILAVGWIPFAVFLGVSVAFAFTFVIKYQHKQEKELLSTIVAMLGIVVALLVCALVPVDVYLVSSFKDSDGTFHNWAIAHMEDVENTVRFGYYAVYALVVVFCFFIIPLAYFFFEAKDEVEQVSNMKRFISSLKYTLGFLIVMGVLMCIGAFAISTNGSSCPDLTNSTAKQAASCRAEYAESSLTSNSGNNAISFTIGALTTFGVLYFVVYTGFGLAAFPLDMIRSRRADSEDMESAQRQLSINQKKRTDIENKYRGKKKSMSARDRRTIEKIDHEDRVVGTAVRRTDQATGGFCGAIGTALRPFKFIFGIAFLLLSFFFAASLAITAGDKLLQIHKQKLNWKTGYTEAAPEVKNPVDLAMSTFQKAFPVDYIILAGMVYYFLLCTMAGVRHLGVRFCGMKLFDIRPRRTVPQGLLFLCIITMLSLLFLNVILLTLAPQYITYGNQHYPAMPSSDACDIVSYPSSDAQICSSKAPRYVYIIRSGNDVFQSSAGGVYDPASSGCDVNFIQNVCNMTSIAPDAKCERQEACVTTRVAALLHSFFYNVWFFGAIYYWANWAVVFVFFFSFVYLTCSRRKSLLQVFANDSKNDFYDSDDDMTPFNASWAK